MVVSLVLRLGHLYPWIPSCKHFRGKKPKKPGGKKPWPKLPRASLAPPAQPVRMPRGVQEEALRAEEDHAGAHRAQDPRIWSPEAPSRRASVPRAPSTFGKPNPSNRAGPSQFRVFQNRCERQPEMERQDDRRVVSPTRSAAPEQSFPCTHTHLQRTFGLEAPNPTIKFLSC